MEIVSEMQLYYEKRAVLYDRSMGYDDPTVRAALQPVVERMQDLLRGRKVLEIACGPCFWSSQVSQAVQSITATDYNRATLAMARRKPLDWNKITLVAADAYHLPVQPATFDACVAVDWFSHVPRSRIASFLSGLHDRLRGGGVVVLCDRLPHAHETLTDFDEEGNHLQQRLLPDGSTYHIIKHFFTDTEYFDIFSPYTAAVSTEHFPHCRRVLVWYQLGDNVK